MKNANSKQQQADEISLKLTVPEVCKFTSALFPLKAGKRGEGVGPEGKVFFPPLLPAFLSAGKPWRRWMPKLFQHREQNFVPLKDFRK